MHSLTGFNPRFSAKVDKGFTLLEVVVILGLIVAVVSLGFFSFPSFQRRVLLDTEASQLVAMLRLAQSKSMAQEEDFSHKVIISNTSYSLVREDGTVLDVRHVEQPLTLTYSHPEITFDKLTGIVAECTLYCTISITVTGLSQEKRVSVSHQGVINVQ